MTLILEEFKIPPQIVPTSTRLTYKRHQSDGLHYSRLNKYEHAHIASYKKDRDMVRQRQLTWLLQSTYVSVKHNDQNSTLNKATECQPCKITKNVSDINKTRALQLISLSGRWERSSHHTHSIQMNNIAYGGRLYHTYKRWSRRLTHVLQMMHISLADR